MTGPALLPRLARLALLVGALAVVYVLSRHWPSDHTVHVVLGDGAPRVTEVRLRYLDVGADDPGHRGGRAASAEPPEREVTFRYAKGHAPRIVSHEPRLVSGDYDVEIEMSIAPDGLAAQATRTVVVERRLGLGDSPVSVDVASSVAAARQAPALSASPDGGGPRTP